MDAASGDWKWPLLALALMLAAALGVAWYGLGRNPQASTDSTADFVLQSADGPLDTRNLRGQVVLVYFGYTYCPDICPTSLTATAQALADLTPTELARVKTVFVSVDPERDTPVRLKEYAAFFHPSMVGVTGTAEQIAKAAAAYGAIYLRQPPGNSGNYAVDHSTWTYVLAPDGHLASRIAHGSSAAQVATEIRKWLPAATPSSIPSPKEGRS